MKNVQKAKWDGDFAPLRGQNRCVIKFRPIYIYIYFKKIISSHNAKILSEKVVDPPCNCRNKNDCPLNGQCKAKNIVYQAIVTTEQVPPAVETYIGMTATEFKDRYANHKQSFNKSKHRNQTTLSQYIWELKENQVDFSVKWKILDRARTFTPITGVCGLCTLEKFYIFTRPEEAKLNRHDEIFKPCLHRKKLLLENT